MTILEIIRKRRSVRDFVDKEIPENVIEDLIEAIRWAPSAGNLQSRKFYFVLNKDVRMKLSQTGLRRDFVSFIAYAPLVVVACADLNIVNTYKERGVHLYCVQDSAASIQNLLLVAQEHGLGTCWTGAFDEIKVKDVLNLPENLRPVAIIPVGYPAKTPGAPSRISGAEAVEIVR